MMITLFVLLGLILLAATWIRLAPVDASRWHQFPENADPRIPDSATPNSRLSHRSYAESAKDIMERLNGVALQTPRTKVLAGLPEDGMVTYVTRSRIWGFPDYTTAIARTDDAGGTTLMLFGRAGIGAYDWGVNGKRIDLWLEALDS
ncbi:MAG: DUF1499 domain-containing protein [Pseudomonadota bacterium]